MRKCHVRFWRRVALATERFSLMLLYRIGFHLWMHDAEGEGVSEQVENALSRIESELSAGERLSLIDALVNQLKYQLRNLL